MENLRDCITKAAESLRQAKHVVVFTGAGMSAESGIATFRDRGGLWRDFPPDQFGNLPGLERTALYQPRRLAEFLIQLLEPIAAAEPNDGHRAVAALQDHTRVTVVTQNVDRLHQDAGSREVWEIHGSLFTIIDSQGDVLRTLSRRQLREIVTSLWRLVDNRVVLLPQLMWRVRTMFGFRVGGTYRPDIVLFGESMADPAWVRAMEATEQCDCFLSVGTSATVYPAAFLPEEAAAAGTTTIVVDPNGGTGDHVLAGPAARVLPELVEAAFGKAES